MNLEEARAYAKAAMPELLRHHAELVSHRSVAFPGYPEEPMKGIIEPLLDMFRSNGLQDVEVMDVPGGYPAIHALVPGPEGSPVVTFYGHYDVQPVPEAQAPKWETDPWTATLKEDGRIYGRGAADDKSGVVAIAGALGAFKGQLPCTVRLVVEGEEETGSHIEDFVEKNPEKFRSDLFVIADSGSPKVGQPGIGTGLRGTVSVELTVRTLANAVHSGLYGGVAPDALFALITTLRSMYDENGSTVIEGLHQFEWDGGVLEEDAVRAGAGVVEGVSLMGEGALTSRAWSKPAVTVIGLDAVPVDQCSNALNPSARAKVSLRIAPGADPATELETLKKHLAANLPLGVQAEFGHEEMGAPYLVDTTGKYVGMAMAAMTEAYGTDCGQQGSGGSIPLVNVFAATSPGSEVVIWGPQDEEKAAIHGPNESVHPDEIERVVVAGIRLLTMIGEAR